MDVSENIYSQGFDPMKMKAASDTEKLWQNDENC